MLRTLIVDDEAPARQRLARLLDPLAEDDRVELVGQADDGVEALDVIQREAASDDRSEGVDLLLLDIRMPEMSGFDLIGRLAPEERPDVIFTTAYDRYALRAFEENAVDYLLKPIKQERLDEAVSRVEELRQSRPAVSGERLEKLLDWVDAQQEAQQKADEPTGKHDGAAPTDGDGHVRQLSVSLRDRIRLIPTDHVVAIEIHEGITRLFESAPSSDGDDASDGDTLHQHVIDYTLDTLEDRLDPSKFMRVHRSAIVRLDCIEEMVPWRSGRYKLLLKGNHEVVASRDRSRRLRDRLMI
jgi:two-component system LytT family response regulator